MSKASLVMFCAVLIVFSSVSFARNNSESLSEQPTVVAAVASILSPIARQARVESDVKVEVKIDEKGNVQSAKVISGHPLVSKASETAAKKWKFNPLGQEASVRTVQLTFSFWCLTGCHDLSYVC